MPGGSYIKFKFTGGQASVLHMYSKLKCCFHGFYHDFLKRLILCYTLIS